MKGASSPRPSTSLSLSFLYSSLFLLDYIPITVSATQIPLHYNLRPIPSRLCFVPAATARKTKGINKPWFSFLFLMGSVSVFASFFLPVLVVFFLALNLTLVLVSDRSFRDRFPLAAVKGVPWCRMSPKGRTNRVRLAQSWARFERCSSWRRIQIGVRTRSACFVCVH